MPRQETGEPSNSSTVDVPISGTTDGGLRIRQIREQRPEPRLIGQYLRENPASISGSQRDNATGEYYPRES